MVDHSLQAILNEASTTGLSYKEAVRRFMVDNPDDFPLYVNSDAFDDSDDATIGRDNDDKKTLWF